MNSNDRPAAPRIRLLIADVDGTLVTPQKEVTERAREAALGLREEDIGFAITSGRPPRGMRMFVEPLGITTPIAAFNGGMLVKPDLSVIEQHTLPAGISAEVIRTISKHGLDVWVYRGCEWYVRERHGPHVDREEWTVQFGPTVVAGFDELGRDIAKIVGVSDDAEAMARCEVDVRREFGEHVSASCSQPYYLDVTHPKANKGAAIRRFSEVLHIPLEEIATIGDMPNDVLMFALSGLSIAMGNAGAQVQRAARHVTTRNDEEGFATAVERYVLAGRGRGLAATDFEKRRASPRRQES